ncbi:MAG: mevalonate kinase [Candidatus Bathyarchaeota archaeon B26-2]|nr:MAG: mevalonate kinase [Candidatus Bathyarchaeota archaeon B26-2]
MRVTASAPAKVILFGEHFVVYGEPALVMAVERRVYVSTEPRTDCKIYIRADGIGASGYYSGEALRTFEAEMGGREAQDRLQPIKVVIEHALRLSKKKVGLNVIVKSAIPVAAGLGSSAAVAVATAAAVGRVLGLELSREEVYQIAYEAEKVIHGTPSGIDPAISTYGGTLIYRRGEGVKPLTLEVEVPLVIGNTGLSRSTGDLVARVRRLKDRYPSIVEPILSVGGKIVAEAIMALKAGDLEALGNLMDINHGLLSAVGVSSGPLERLVYAARRAGALGAKLTGAGGGGCMVALTATGDLDKVARAIEEAGGETLTATRAKEGVRIEEQR